MEKAERKVERVEKAERVEKVMRETVGKAERRAGKAERVCECSKKLLLLAISCIKVVGPRVRELQLLEVYHPVLVSYQEIQVLKVCLI